MAEIHAGLVKQLREMTGLGMMECKKALMESGGDLKRAEELLRIRSGAKASKAATRIAAEGLVAAYLAPDAKVGALVEINCETDFVAKNEEFVAFGAQLARLAAERAPQDAAALAALDDVEARRQALVQKIGENIAIRRLARIATEAKLARYVHGGRIGVLVEYEGPEEVARDVAMHIAFARPAYLSAADVPTDVIERERAILAARAKEAGKPDAIAQKMVAGGLEKFLAEATLLGQPFVKDDRLTVGAMLAARGAKVLGYRFLVVGEGIEKKSGDFAAEVKAAAQAAR